MTLDTWVKQELEEMFRDAFTSTNPDDIQVINRDFMEIVKSPLPPNIKTTEHLMRYFSNSVLSMFDFCPKANVAVAHFDRQSPKVKEIVCHSKRNDKRCKLCKLKEPLAKGVVAGPEFFDPECKSNCINEQTLWYEQGPYWDRGEWLVANWTRFARDSRNLRREFYPRLANALLGVPLVAGKQLFVSGLPFKTREVHAYEDGFERGFSRDQKRVQFEFWDNFTEELHGTDTILIQGFPQQLTMAMIVPEMKHDIHEADNSIFFYSKFFKPSRNFLYYINDGDAISIGLFRALEDIHGPGPEGHGAIHWLCLPNKGNKRQFLKQNHTFINLNRLAELIDEHPEFKKAGIQSPIATMIFLIILTDTDFFQGEFCSGIGCKTKWSDNEEKRKTQTKGVWDTFFSQLSRFSHLVQYYPTVKDASVERRVVIDEKLFEIFTQECYISKYGESAKKKQKVDDVDYDVVQLHCSALKKESDRAPDASTIQRWCRQIDWNINYWANGFRNIYPDPFEKVNGVPYYGYDQEMGLVSVVAAQQKDVDEKFKRHFLKRAEKKEFTKPLEPIPESRKEKALNALRGK